jgi:hypothetical protein
MKSNSTLKSIYALARLAPYDDENKAKYKAAALKFLRALAKYLKLDKETFQIRFNAGGPAVAGDPILHHDKFYINLYPGACGGGYWRECAGQKDYCGKHNRFISDDETVVSLGNAIRKVVVPNVFPVYGE